ncbi:MAG: hypothetical protein AAGF99_14165 [Bacteroidota bacterium]
MRFCVAALALLLVPAAFAGDDPVSPSCQADLVGLAITVPEGFADNQHLVAPEGTPEAPTLVLCSFVDEATGRFFVVEVHTYFDAARQAAWARGDETAAHSDIVLTSTAAPVLNVEVDSARDMDFEEGHGVMVYGCEAGNCYKLVASGSADTERDALVDVLRGVRFEG